jgi:hypothetical protein
LEALDALDVHLDSIGVTESRVLVILHDVVLVHYFTLDVDEVDAINPDRFYDQVLNEVLFIRRVVVAEVE